MRALVRLICEKGGGEVSKAGMAKVKLAVVAVRPDVPQLLTRCCCHCCPINATNKQTGEGEAR